MQKNVASPNWLIAKKGSDPLNASKNLKPSYSGGFRTF